MRNRLSLFVAVMALFVMSTVAREAQARQRAAVSSDGRWSTPAVRESGRFQAPGYWHIGQYGTEQCCWSWDLAMGFGIIEDLQDPRKQTNGISGRGV